MAFDFDYWAGLAHTDPDRFERERQAMIQAAIAGSRQSPRLVALQWRIDQEVKRSRTALAACLRLNRLMWHAFDGMNTALETFREEGSCRTGGKDAGKAAAGTGRLRVVENDSCAGK